MLNVSSFIRLLDRDIVTVLNRIIRTVSVRSAFASMYCGSHIQANRG
jgi:hypothetical protein